MREREIARNSGDEQVERLLASSGALEEGRQLELADGEGNSDRREVSLNQLFHRVVAATHGEQLERDPSLAGPVAAMPGRVEQRVGHTRCAPRCLEREWVLQWDR